MTSVRTALLPLLGIPWLIVAGITWSAVVDLLNIDQPVPERPLGWSLAAARARRGCWVSPVTTPPGPLLERTTSSLVAEQDLRDLAQPINAKGRRVWPRPAGFGAILPMAFPEPPAPVFAVQLPITGETPAVGALS